MNRRIHLCPGSQSKPLNHHSVMSVCPSCHQHRKVLRTGRLETHMRPDKRHEPFNDDGVTYCGWWGDVGIIDGCGEIWPCTHAFERKHQ